MRTITVEIPSTLTIETRDSTYHVETAAWSGAFVAYLAERGLKENIVNASAGKKGSAATDATQAKVAQMAAGEIPTGGGGKRLDDVEREARVILAGAIVRGGHAKTQAEAEKAIRAAGGAVAYVEARGGDPEPLLAKARAVVAERSAADDLDLGI